MGYRYQRPDPKECFSNWLDYQSELIHLTMHKGYTKEQAIELLKVWELDMIADNIGHIG